MPSFCCLFITDSNCRTACKGQGIRDPLRSYSNNSFFFDLKVLNALCCCLFITDSNCRTACLGWGGRTQFDLFAVPKLQFGVQDFHKSRGREMGKREDIYSERGRWVSNLLSGNST